MVAPPRVRSALARSLDRALFAIATAGLLLGGFEYALLPVDAGLEWVLAGLPLLFWIYLAAGLVAWRQRPSNPMGLLILWSGLCVFLGSLGNTEAPALQAIGAICQVLVMPATAHLLLAFPGGSLSVRRDRIIVLIGYTVAILTQAPQYLFNPRGTFPPFAIADLPGVSAGAALVQSVLGGAVLIAVAVLLIARLRAAEPPQRRVLIPLYAYGIFVLLFIPFSSLVLVRVMGVAPTVRGLLQFIAVAGTPLAFVLGMTRGGFARTGELEELGTWLGAAVTTKEPLAAALARALGDPTLDLYFWATDRREYVSVDGRAAHDPDADPRRGWQEVRVDGRRVGGISYDAELLRDRDLVRTAGNVVAIAVERERLTAELRASGQALQASRERIVEAADRERSRIARDLHDGIQVQLVMLALDAQRLGSAPPDAIESRATRLRSDIDDAAANLRRLVHDLMPAALIERGLVAATEDLVDRMPIPTRLHSEISDGSLDRADEYTAYFVLAEGLANVVKHARARSAEVRITRTGDVVRVEVHDDGRGGASMEAGTGLRGLADRVDAAGGTMTLRSIRGEGTHLWVELTCVS
ncbi:MAG: ATPase [Microbacterium sp.]|nr:ATPase [Microbacterium sp.]